MLRKQVTYLARGFYNSMAFFISCALRHRELIVKKQLATLNQGACNDDNYPICASPMDPYRKN